MAWSRLAENQGHSESPRRSKRLVKCLEEKGKVTTGPSQGVICNPSHLADLSLPGLPAPAHPSFPQSPPALHPLPCSGSCAHSTDGPQPCLVFQARGPGWKARSPGNVRLPASAPRFLISVAVGSSLRWKFSSWVLFLPRQASRGKLGHGSPAWAGQLGLQRSVQTQCPNSDRDPRRQGLSCCALNSRCSQRWGGPPFRPPSWRPSWRATAQGPWGSQGGPCPRP